MLEKKEGSLPKKKLPRFLRISGWILVGLVILILLTGLFFQTPTGGRLILGWAARAIETETGLQLQADKLRLNIFTLKLSLSGLRLKASDRTQLPFTRINAEKILLQSGWSTLLGREVRIRNLEIIKPAVFLEPRPANQKTEPETVAREPVAGAARFSFRVDRFHLEQGELSFIEPGRPLSLIFSDFEIKVHFEESTREHLAEIRSRDGSLKLGDGQLELKSLELETSFTWERFTLSRFYLKTPGSEIRLSGTLNNFLERPEFSLKTSADLNLEEVQNFLGLNNLYAGSLHLEFTASGQEKQPLIEGLISGRALKLYGQSPVDLDLSLKPLEDFGHHLNLSIFTEMGKMDLEARISAGWRGPWKGSLVLDRLSLGWLSALSPELSFELKGILSGRLEAEGKDWSAEGVKGRAELRIIPDAMTSSSSLKKLLLPLSGSIILGYSEKNLEVQRFEFQLLDSELNLKGRLVNFEKISALLSISLDSVRSTLNSLKAAAGQELIPGMEGQLKNLGEFDGKLSLKILVSGSLPSPDLDLTLEGREFKYQDFILPSLIFKAEGRPNRINLSRLELNLTEGQLTGKGKVWKIYSTGEPVFGLEGRFEVLDVGLKQFSYLLSEEFRSYLSGHLNGTVVISGNSKTPSSDFDLRLSAGQAGSLKIDSLEITGILSPKEWKVDRVDLKLPEGQLFGSFLYRPQPKEIQAQLTGRSIKVADFNTWLPVLKAGQVDFILEASGNWKSPVAELKFSGQGFMIDRVWMPYFELQVIADGNKARVDFEVPRFNLKIDSELDFKNYWLSGNVTIKELPLSSLAGILPEVEETTPLTALSSFTSFSLPLSRPEDLRVDFRFENFDFAGLAVLLPELKNLNPTGRADGRIELKGFSPDLSVVEMSAEIPGLNLKLNEVEIRNERPLKFGLKDKKLRLESFELIGGRSRLSLSGSSELTELTNPSLDFRLEGQVELSDFNPWLTGMTAGGKIQLKASLAGNLERPLVEGSGLVQDVFFRIQDLPVVVSSIRALFRIDNSRLVLERLTGLANSGTFQGTGEAAFGQNFSLATARVDFKLNDFDFNYPSGLSSLSEARLALTKEKSGWLLSGDFSLLSASYREDFYPSTQGLKMAFTRVSPVGTEFPPFLYDLALNVNLRTVEDIIIKNNLADLELKANLNVKGTIPAPILTGRLENSYTGEIIVGDRKYTAERLRVDFLGRENLEPNLDILLKSTVYDQEEEVEVSLVLTGTPSDLNFSLTSVPTRSQEDLASLLLTGKSLREVQGSALNTISSQLVQHFSSPLASPVTRTLKRWLKAEDIIIEPLNIATLQDPGARLTVRKRMTREFAVTYSIDLTNSQYQTWILDYQLRRSFSARGFRRDDGVVGANLRHRISVGEKPDFSLRREKGSLLRKLGGIEISGQIEFPEEELIKNLKLKKGKLYSNADLRKRVNRLETWYRKQGFFNIRIDKEVLDKEDGSQVLKLSLQTGSPVEFRFVGDKIPTRLRKKALSSWAGRLPEEANLHQLRSVILTELNSKGYYRAEIELNQLEQGRKTIYEVKVKNNGRWKIVGFRLEGTPVYNESMIKRVVASYFGAKAKGLWNLIYDRKIALELIRYFYEENGYLEARIENPIVGEDPSRRLLTIGLKIEAGPRSQVASVEFEGLRSFQEEELRPLLNLGPGSVFSWPALYEDRTVLVNRYRSAGFKDVRIETRAEPVEGGPNYQVKIIIDEGPVYSISQVEVQGTRRTRSSFVLRESGLKTGEPASLEKLAQAQKNLYDSGVFQSVNVQSLPESPDSHQERVQIQLRERPWLSLTYGLQYNTDTKFEGFGQIDFNNIFGLGWNSLLYFRANQRQQDARATLHIPYLFSWRADSLLSAFYLKDIKDLFITEQLGISFQQRIRVVRGFDLSWMYRFSRIHDYEREPSWPFPYDVRITSSELSMLLNRDTRDDKFDPKKGFMLSSTFSYSPRFLGSDLNYLRSFTQFTMYKSLLQGVIWASGYRLGLSTAFGESLIYSKRFFAGGGTSIRGFKLDAVGPLDIWTGLPEGGEAMLVVNQELRFPIYKIFRGVAFLDVGNVYSRLSDFNPLKLRTGAGLGLRIESPLGLIRIDYGFNLKPRPGEPKGALFFSLGQAF